MANKNHALDGQIVQAAMQEFLDNGFEKASLRKIAASANVTVGAIYTRYNTKDCLFCSLVEPLIQRIGTAFSQIKADYYGENTIGDLRILAQSMEKESDAILHLLFDDYDRAVLLLCKSRGSSLEHFFDQVVERKIQETLAFFDQAGMKQIDANVLRLLTYAQFNMYFQIISQGWQLDEAKKMMKAAMIYHTGGWHALLGLQNQ